MGHSDGQQNCFVINLDHCVDTTRNVTGLQEGKQDNEYGLVIRDLEGKGNTLECCSSPQTMCICSIRHWIVEGQLWQGCFLCPCISVPEAQVMLLSICSLSMLLTRIFLTVESSVSMGWQRPSSRPISCTLPASGFAWISNFYV